MINGKFTDKEKLKISIRTREAMSNPQLRKHLSEKKTGQTPWNKGISTASNGELEKYMNVHGAWNKGIVGSKSGAKNGMWKGGLPKCIDCERPHANRNAKRCAICNKKWQRGKNLYNWKGGLKQCRENYQYKKWRKSVYGRDFFTCQFCGKHCGKDIQAHHIVQWIDDREERFNIDNGLTLCQSCHLKTRGREDFYAPLCKNLVNLKNNPMYAKNILSTTPAKGLYVEMRFELP